MGKYLKWNILDGMEGQFSYIMCDLYAKFTICSWGTDGGTKIVLRGQASGLRKSVKDPAL